MTRTRSAFLGVVILAAFPGASLSIGEEGDREESQSRSESFVDRMFDRLDQNNDGSISKDEFKESFEQRRGARRGADSVRRGRERSRGPRSARSDRRRFPDRRGGPRMSGRGFRGPAGGPPSYRQGGRAWREGPWRGGDRMARGPAPRYCGGPPRGWGYRQSRGPDFGRAGGPPWYRAGSPSRGPQSRAESSPAGRGPGARRAEGPPARRQRGPSGCGEWTPPGPDGPRGRRGGPAWRGAGASTDRSDLSPDADGELISGERGGPPSTEDPSGPSIVAAAETASIGDVVDTETVPQSDETDPAVTR